MAKYDVTILIDACNGVTVDAESPDDAADLAYDSDGASPGICHYCSRVVELGDCLGVIVYDESGEEVLNDTVSDGIIKRLEAKIKGLESKLVEANNG